MADARLDQASVLAFNQGSSRTSVPAFCLLEFDVSAAVRFPRIRFRQFGERRIRRPVQGSLVDESTDVLLTEPVASQVRRFLSSNENIVLHPTASHTVTDLRDGERMIDILYTLTVIGKAEAAQLIYGT